MSGIVINPPITLAKILGGLAYDPINRRMFVAAQSPPGVFVIDTTTNSVIGPINVGAGPAGIAYDSVNRRMYVTNTGSTTDPTTVVVIDTMTTPPSVIPPAISVGESPIGIAYDPVNKRMYVLIDPPSGPGTVSVIDTMTTPPSIIPPPVHVGVSPQGIAHDPVNKRMYVTDFGTHTPGPGPGTVSVIDTMAATPTIIGSPITVGNSAAGIAYDPVNRRMYVTNFWSNNVSAIDTNTNNVIGSPISVGLNPAGIAYDPVHQRMYVTNDGSNNVYVIDTNTVPDVSAIGPNNVIGSPIPVDKNPDSIAYDPVHQRMYVTNFGSDTVFVIDIGSNAQTICPQANIQHWNKIIFKVDSADIARQANLPVDSEVEIKLLGNPEEVADIKKKILEFVHIQDTAQARRALQIIAVDYAIVCGLS